ncbi:MAG: cysteine methyltransferase [Idiomarina sp.]|uniref:methylated-DNA--[protein]-cysteine S-methyltransferase n=1 Tax=Idiomarina aquatica TaxID=1327752 RepID=A0A4R6PPT7_9GAMM|nr:MULTISPECIES: methylated-DNA--[protein]-cysteine S-methyltransferase [Idiomarina]MAK72316.1 cysteine methyltransferase [Idiomarinaceae bacterium]MBL4742221.1 methylated-DNA--[protein]-cysteine S-methyltransferase [Idiomarina sp.]MBT41874.1 cysteine methyltransferase [Idiomarina sp.]PHQ77165.1 MAG: cysteine methyltransferase [Idiomarina sp.]TDP40488.1 methylated-DNA-[protein]-cysteine S-methyltransferase [Idiomarina aquatica]
MHHIEFTTPLGHMVAIADDRHLTGLYYRDQKNLPDLSTSNKATDHPVLLQTREQLEQYFAGKRQRFSLPLRVQSTEFQSEVLQQLQKVEPGRTLSYKEIAEKIGKPKSVRAVANAIARNPLIIVIPCHRVIGIKGELRGFAAGIERKKALLEQEGCKVV